MTEKTTSVVESKYYGLEYVSVTFHNCKVHPEYGPLIHAKVLQKVELEVAKGILERNYPIRGKELRFIRKVAGLNSRAVADFFRVTHPTILAWEKIEEPLPTATEVALRVLFAAHLGITLPKSAKKMMQDSLPKAFEVSTNAA